MIEKQFIVAVLEYIYLTILMLKCLNLQVKFMAGIYIISKSVEAKILTWNFFLVNYSSIWLTFSKKSWKDTSVLFEVVKK